MKTLRQALIDYEMALLKAIAGCRGIPLPTTNRREAVDMLAEALLSPGDTAIILAGLSPAEQEALQFLLNNGGKTESPRFTRQYGAIRPMGPARLERERPWQAPVNPAEGLWYRGLIFKAFDLTTQGGLEVVYIPDDLASQIANYKLQITNGKLQADQPQTELAAGETVVPPKALTLTLIPAPHLILSDAGRVRENMFNLLVYLHTTPVRVSDKTGVTPRDRAGLVDCLLPAMLPHTDPGLELDFLLHLGQRAGLLAVKHNRLRPERDPVRAWLQQTAAAQTQFLQNTWRADPTWNDLWHTPGLSPRPTGWENSPMLARSKILEHLSGLEAAPAAWYTIDDFVAAIKRLNPDFQRPTGDYESWYIQDAEGHVLMGFENWDKVEGALLRHFLTHVLPWLGVVDLGLPGETNPPAAFRLTAPGRSFLTEQPAPPPAEKTPFLRADPNFFVHVPAQASLFDRFQLARFAQLDRREPERVVYQITQTSVSRALRNGVSADQMAAFLARVTNNRTPLKVVETLRTWGSRQDTVKFEQVMLLRLKSDTLAAELRQNPRLAPLLGESLNPQTILLPEDKVAEARRILKELGYLE